MMFKKSLIVFLLIIGFLAFNDAVNADDSWKNFYAMAWRDSASNTCRYAKSMGYDYIAIRIGTVTTAYDIPEANNLKFYVTDPHRWVKPPFLTNFNGSIIYAPSYATSTQNFCYQYAVYGSDTTFPYNLAGCGGAESDRITQVMLNFQDQSVIDYAVDSNISYVGTYEIPARNFTFAGVLLDEPRLTGDFFYWGSATAKQVACGIDYWTGTTSGLVHGTVTHEYAVWNDALAAYYKQLVSSMTAVYPDFKWGINPYWIYNSGGGTNSAEWVSRVSQRSDKGSLTPHLLMEEGDNLNFQNPNIFTSGMAIDYTMVGSTCPDNYEESFLRLQTIGLGTMSAWSGWFGLFSGGAAAGGNYQVITEVDPRIKLIKCIPNWDNLTLTGLSTATTRYTGNDNGTASYYSIDTNHGNRRNSYISNKVSWARYWKDLSKIYAVFGTNSPTMGTITIAPNETLTAAYTVNSYFEAATATSDFVYNDITKTISLAGTVTVDAGSWTGYILQLGTVTAYGDSAYTGGQMTRSGGIMTVQ